MSKVKGRRPYIEGLKVAMRLEALLKIYCERIEIAGSIRRRAPWVGDIEMVAIPRKRYIQTLLGEEPVEKTYLDEHLEAYPDIYQMVRSGERMKQLLYEGFQVDIFLTDPERWGVIFLLRTGSADFSKWLVTSRNQGGARAVDRIVKEGRVWEVGATDPLSTPQEEHTFHALRVPWVPLEQRHKGYWGVDMETWKPILTTQRC